MKYTNYLYPSACVEMAAFSPLGEVGEYHLMIHATNPLQTYKQQLDSVLTAYAILLGADLKGAVAVFKRFFISDSANQWNELQSVMADSSDCACSIVEQPPLDGTKVALWVYLQAGVQTRFLHNGLYEVRHGAYRHLWQGGAFNCAANSEYQMRLLFNEYVMQLMEQQCTLAGNCIRTWIFVRDVDLNYPGVVKARNEIFVTQNLTEHTHYIASTGIGGSHVNPKVLVTFDTYAVDGLCPAQVKYLYARTHLNPTYEYGVTFERGTAVEYGDRRHIFISGTASINNRGEIVCPGDIRRQTERMWENVEALLKEADSCFEDVGQMIVYLRDMADYSVVKGLFNERFPCIPKVITQASVCRSGWLIEMECMGIRQNRNQAYADF